MAHDVFISHSSMDKTAADAVCAVLESKGIRCWVTPRDVLPGSDWSASIVDAIKHARIMVLVFSGHANDSPHIGREVERAASKRIPIIAIRIEHVQPTDSLEYFLSTRHWLDAFTPPLEQHLEHLAKVVGQILERPSADRATGLSGGRPSVLPGDAKELPRVVAKTGKFSAQSAKANVTEPEKSRNLQGGDQIANEGKEPDILSPQPTSENRQVAEERVQAVEGFTASPLSAKISEPPMKPPTGREGAELPPHMPKSTAVQQGTEKNRSRFVPAIAVVGGVLLMAALDYTYYCYVYQPEQLDKASDRAPLAKVKSFADEDRDATERAKVSDRAILENRNNLAWSLVVAGEYVKAEQEIRPALNIIERTLEPKEPVVLASRDTLGEALRGQGRLHEAESVLRETLAVAEQSLGAESQITPEVAYHLALTLEAEGQPTAAKEFAQRAAEEAKKALGADNPDRAKYEKLWQELQSKN